MKPVMRRSLKRYENASADVFTIRDDIEHTYEAMVPKM
jgi:hypothetical protein